MPKNKHPNIILIVLDTARAKNFSCYGYHRKTTPNIERIAEEGVLYKWCFSPANWTIPSHASLFTGLYPSKHLCTAYSLYLNENIVTLPEILRGAGYFTVGISCNGLISKTFGFERGFEIYKEYCGPGFLNFFLKGKTRKERFKELFCLFREGNFDAIGQWAIKKFLKNRLSVIANSVPYTRKAIYFAEKVIRQSSKPLFLFINLMEAHAVYNPPYPFRGKWSSPKISHQKALGKIKAYPDYYDYYAHPELQASVKWVELVNLYDEELCFVDSVIGYLFQLIESLGSHDNTFFIVTSDHGEMLGEHNLYGHVWGLYNELIHVPLVIRHPDFGSNKTVENVVQLHDLFSTILDIANLPYPAPEDSMSLCSSERRTVAICEDIDSEMDLVNINKRNPFLSICSPWDSCGWALIDESLIKIIETKWGYREVYDLKIDYSEEEKILTDTNGLELEICNSSAKIIQHIQQSFLKI